MNEDRFRVEVDGRTFEIDTGGGSLSVDGKRIDASVIRVAGNTYSILVNGESHEVTIVEDGSSTAISGIAGTHDVSVYDRTDVLLRESEAASKLTHTTEVRSPMPGLVLKIEVSDGQSVQSGTGLLVLEAMKMENEIFSSGDAVVEQVHVREVAAVTKGQLLVTMC